MIGVPTRTSGSTSIIVVKGTQDPFSDVHCVFESFPLSTVTWTKGNDRNVVEATDRVNIINVAYGQTDSNITRPNDKTDFTYTINGGIVIDKLEYDDADIYYCMANNGYGKNEAYVRLRVRGM